MPVLVCKRVDLMRETRAERARGCEGNPDCVGRCGEMYRALHNWGTDETRPDHRRTISFVSSLSDEYQDNIRQPSFGRAALDVGVAFDGRVIIAAFTSISVGAARSGVSDERRPGKAGNVRGERPCRLRDNGACTMVGREQLSTC